MAKNNPDIRSVLDIDEWEKVQDQLAKLTGIPVRTIQQYEQGQKDINRARAEYLIALSRALYCDPQLLLENGLPEDGEAEAGE